MPRSDHKWKMEPHINIFIVWWECWLGSSTQILSTYSGRCFCVAHKLSYDLLSPFSFALNIKLIKGNINEFFLSENLVPLVLVAFIYMHLIVHHFVVWAKNLQIHNHIFYQREENRPDCFNNRKIVTSEKLHSNAWSIACVSVYQKNENNNRKENSQVFSTGIK